MKLKNLISSVVALAIIPSVVHAQDQSINIFVRATDSFLHVFRNDSSTTPQVVDLQSAGLSTGNEIHFNATGNWCKWSPPPTGLCPDTSVNVLGVFSSSGTVLPPSSRYRIPDAIDSGNNVITGPTYYSSEPTDIEEDFQILSSGFSIVIPEGATHLLLGSVDSNYRDNSGGFNINIFTVDKCINFAISSVMGTEQVINPLPLAGQNIALDVAVTGNSNPAELAWNLSANSQVVAEGVGIEDGIAWDGRNGAGIIEAGTYDLLLSIANTNVGCAAEQSITAVLELTDNCKLRATFPTPGVN